jgi:F-type H+-transporting ATPase subunit delta
VASGGTTISLGGGLPGRYAAALYDLADERRELDLVVEQMDALGRLIDQSAPLRRLLGSPLVDVMQASAALRAVLEPQGFGKTVLDFTGVIAANRRLAALRTIVTAFATLVAQKRGVVVAGVTTAHPLTDVQREQLRARLIESGYGNVNLYDTSLKSRLQRLQYAMKGAA